MICVMLSDVKHLYHLYLYLLNVVTCALCLCIARQQDVISNLRMRTETVSRSNLLPVACLGDSLGSRRAIFNVKLKRSDTATPAASPNKFVARERWEGC